MANEMSDPRIGALLGMAPDLADFFAGGDEMSTLDIRGVPVSELPRRPTGQPSIEELMQEGRVQVTPGATGATALPRSQSASLDLLSPEHYRSMRKGYLEDILTAPSTSPEYAARAEKGITGIRSEEETEAKLRAQTAQPGLQAQAEVQAEAGKHPYQMQQIAAKGAQDVAAIQARAAEEERLLRKKPFASGVLQGFTLEHLEAMRPEQREALLGMAGLGGMQGMGQFLTAISTAQAAGAFGDPLSLDSGETRDSFLAMFLSRGTGKPLSFFLVPVKGRDGKVRYRLSLKGLMPDTTGVAPGMAPAGPTARPTGGPSGLEMLTP